MEAPWGRQHGESEQDFDGQEQSIQGHFDGGAIISKSMEPKKALGMFRA